MFEAVARDIEELEIPVDGAAIAEAVALRDRLSAKVAAAVGTFDEARLWDLDAATSMTGWLRDKAAMTNREAARTAMAAKRLRALPLTAAAWRSGELSSGQVEAVLAVLDRRTLPLFSDHEAALIPSLVGLSVTDTTRAMAHWKAHASALGEDPEPSEQERPLHLSRPSTVAAEPSRSPAERRADALVDLCRFFLDHQRHRPGGRHRPHVNVVVDYDDLLAGRGAGWSTAPTWTARASRRCCATVRCTGW